MTESWLSKKSEKIKGVPLSRVPYGTAQFRMIAFCRSCCTYGTPFAERNDRVCGNCNRDGLIYLLEDTALEEALAALDKAEAEKEHLAKEAWEASRKRARWEILVANWAQEWNVDEAEQPDFTDWLKQRGGK